MDRHSLHIRSHCIIRGRSIYVNGRLLLQMDASATLNDFLKTAYRQLNTDYPKFHKMDGLCKANFVATELLARESGPFHPETALVFSNFSSSILADSRHADAIFAAENAAASPATFVYTLPNIAMGEISIRHQLRSENVFFIFDSYLPEFLVPYIHSLLDGQPTRNAISGWTEVTEQTCDLLLYYVSTQGKTPHTVEEVKKIYNEQHE
ncbi:hypothetical protein ACFOET_15015 [Parapedobacter deserti]|uniref:3-oxoacyl-ACP synthase n=1 Tax=Parapedobacter deserti TaxID=1912957 RepID=A0ABV7JP21_9SPHI